MKLLEEMEVERSSTPAISNDLCSNNTPKSGKTQRSSPSPEENSKSTILNGISLLGEITNGNTTSNSDNEYILDADGIGAEVESYSNFDSPPSLNFESCNDIGKIGKIKNSELLAGGSLVKDFSSTENLANGNSSSDAEQTHDSSHLSEEFELRLSDDDDQSEEQSRSANLKVTSKTNCCSKIEDQAFQDVPELNEVIESCSGSGSSEKPTLLVSGSVESDFLSNKNVNERDGQTQLLEDKNIMETGTQRSHGDAARNSMSIDEGENCSRSHLVSQQELDKSTQVNKTCDGSDLLSINSQSCHVNKFTDVLTCNTEELEPSCPVRKRTGEDNFTSVVDDKSLNVSTVCRGSYDPPSEASAQYLEDKLEAELEAEIEAERHAKEGFLSDPLESTVMDSTLLPEHTLCFDSNEVVKVKQEILDSSGEENVNQSGTKKLDRSNIDGLQIKLELKEEEVDFELKTVHEETGIINGDVIKQVDFLKMESKEVLIKSSVKQENESDMKYTPLKVEQNDVKLEDAIKSEGGPKIKNVFPEEIFSSTLLNSSSQTAKSASGSEILSSVAHSLAQDCESPLQTENENDDIKESVAVENSDVSNSLSKDQEILPLREGGKNEKVDDTAVLREEPIEFFGERNVNVSSNVGSSEKSVAAVNTTEIDSLEDQTSSVKLGATSEDKQSNMSVANQGSTIEKGQPNSVEVDKRNDLSNDPPVVPKNEGNKQRTEESIKVRDSVFDEALADESDELEDDSSTMAVTKTCGRIQENRSEVTVSEDGGMLDNDLSKSAIVLMGSEMPVLNSGCKQRSDLERKMGMPVDKDSVNEQGCDLERESVDKDAECMQRNLDVGSKLSPTADSTRDRRKEKAIESQSPALSDFNENNDGKSDMSDTTFDEKLDQDSKSNDCRSPRLEKKVGSPVPNVHRLHDGLSRDNHSDDDEDDDDGDDDDVDDDDDDDDDDDGRSMNDDCDIPCADNDDVIESEDNSDAEGKSDSEPAMTGNEMSTSEFADSNLSLSPAFCDSVSEAFPDDDVDSQDCSSNVNEDRNPKGSCAFPSRKRPLSQSNEDSGDSLRTKRLSLSDLLNNGLKRQSNTVLNSDSKKLRFGKSNGPLPNNCDIKSAPQTNDTSGAQNVDVVSPSTLTSMHDIEPIKDINSVKSPNDFDKSSSSVESVSQKTIDFPFLRTLHRKELTKMSRSDLEELVLQKICEAVTERSLVGELRKRCELLEQRQEKENEKFNKLRKQMNELSIVMKKYLDNQAKNIPAPPIKVTRSVGLQVSQLVHPSLPTTIKYTKVPPHDYILKQNRLPIPKPSLTTLTRHDVTSNTEITPTKVTKGSSCSPRPSASIISSTDPPALVPTSSNTPALVPMSSKPPTTPPRVPMPPLQQISGSRERSSVSPKVTSTTQPVLSRPQPSPIRQSLPSNPNPSPTTPAKKDVEVIDVIDILDKEDPKKKSAIVQISPQQQLHQQKQAATVAAQSLSGNGGLTVRLISPSPQGMAISSGYPQLIVPQRFLATSGPQGGPVRGNLKIVMKSNSGNVIIPMQQSLGATVSSGVVHIPSSTQTAVQQIFTNANSGNRTNTVATVRQIHPAPLPTVSQTQANNPAWKQIPPRPSLKCQLQNNGIVLSWNMALGAAYADIENYQIFAYQENTAPPNPGLWKKVGDVKALPLPMACTLTQFVPGHRYHFTVRAVDKHGRIGPFSQQSSIRLGD